MSKLILDVIKGEKSEVVPIWIMRQAGRYLPRYRKIREKYDFLSLCLNPELAAEITLQPVEILDVDAAIIFSDILIPCFSMGCKIEFIEGRGPVVSNPLRNPQDIKSLTVDRQNEETNRISEAMKITMTRLPQDKALIGFCAAPFTLSCYGVEGGSSKNFLNIKKLIYEMPESYHQLMKKVTQALIHFLKIQAASGADIVQIFDTWGGILSPPDFQRFSWPYLKKLISEFRKEYQQPLIYFMRGSAGLLPILKDLPVEVMGIDWTVSLSDASQRLKNRFVLQGNLDPAVLLSTRKVIKEKTLEVLQQGKELNGHIFNLGHGILPETPVENVRYLVNQVHKFSPK